MTANIKDTIVKQVAEELRQPEDWVDRVVSFQFKEAQAATLLHSEIEISGFGTFLLSQSKLKKRIKKCIQIRDAITIAFESYDEKKKLAAQKKLEAIEELLSFYYRKQKENVTA